MAGQGLFFRTSNLIYNSKSILSKRATYLNTQPLVMGLKVDTRDRLKQLKIPEKPKKPTIPYIKFVSEHRNIILKQYPNIKQTDIIKKCAEDWKTVNSELKEKYSKAYKSECEAYDKKILEFNASLTPEQRDAIKIIGDEKKEDRKKRKLRKINKEMNKPKRPVGAYMSYLLDQSKKRNISVKDLMISLKGEWANLPESEKEKYQKQFLKEKEKYEIDMHQWEQKMLEEGREELVRVKSLEGKKPSRIIHLKKGNPQ